MGTKAATRWMAAAILAAAVGLGTATFAGSPDLSADPAGISTGPGGRERAGLSSGPGSRVRAGFTTSPGTRHLAVRKAGGHVEEYGGGPAIPGVRGDGGNGGTW